MRARLWRGGLWLAVALLATLGWLSVGRAADGPWLRNHADATLYSGTTPDATAFATIPQFQGYFQWQQSVPSAGARLYIYYPGDDAGVQPGYAWVDAAVLGPADGPPPAIPLRRARPTPAATPQPAATAQPAATPQPALATPTETPQAAEADVLWLANHKDATLWSGSGADAVAFATVPAFTGLFRSQAPPLQEHGRVYIYYPGDDAGVAAGFAWVDGDALGPAGGGPPAGPLQRPTPAPTPIPMSSPYVSELPRPLPSGTGRVINHVDTQAPLVALTLDDGIRDDALDILADRHVKATLFLTGAWVSARPDTARRALADGHELGNHTFSHPFLTRTGTASYEIRRASDTIQAATGVMPIPAFRPPYGDWNGSVAAAAGAAGYDVYMWSVDSGGYRQTVTAAGAAATVLNNAHPGSIVLMHVLDPADLGALGTVIDGLRARGLEPCRLSDLLLSAQFG